MKPPLVACVLALFVGAGICAGNDAVTCATCHLEQAGLIGKSVHADLKCQQCHGGPDSYELSAEALAQARPPGGTFDHGDGFGGKVARGDVPERCGTCHADVERMNPYGLRTDQLERYRTSGHGKTLFNKGDDRVAVCIDCHGVHNIFPPDDPQSATHPANVPDMCGRCHEDTALMGEYDLAVEVVDEYRQSIHGRLLLEEGDIGSPTCATCHGNHSAIPPGFAVIGEVCGKCHQTASDLYKGTIHAEQEDFKGCVQCHGGGEDRHLHLIERITQPAGLLTRKYDRLLEA
ncbi:MAG: hypothetical protein GY778_19670, partial [bacterium]|nr:hypothetical protein [bacterium]